MRTDSTKLEKKCSYQNRISDFGRSQTYSLAIINSAFEFSVQCNIAEINIHYLLLKIGFKFQFIAEQTYLANEANYFI